MALCAAILLSAAASGVVPLSSERSEPEPPGFSSAVSAAPESGAPGVPPPKAEDPRVFFSPVSSEENGEAQVSSVPAAEPEGPEYYDVPLAEDVQDLIFSECSSQKVPTDLVVALIGVESGFDPTKVSRTNDYGLMQINICHEDFLKKRLQVTDLLDERQNIRAGVYMLSGIVGRYSDMNRALMVYNCGETGAKRLWKKGVYSTAYSRKVIEAAAVLKGKV